MSRTVGRPGLGASGNFPLVGPSVCLEPQPQLVPHAPSVVLPERAGEHERRQMRKARSSNCPRLDGPRRLHPHSPVVTAATCHIRTGGAARGLRSDDRAEGEAGRPAGDERDRPCTRSQSVGRRLRADARRLTTFSHLIATGIATNSTMSSAISASTRTSRYATAAVLSRSVSRHCWAV